MKVYVGTAAFGCPRSKAPLVFSGHRRMCEGIHKSFLPKPRIVPFSNQAPPHRIVQQVLNLGIQTLRRSQNMIKRFRLPNSSASMESLVDLVCRSSFHRVHNHRERENFHGFVIDERSEDQVNMIRHDDCDLEVKFFSVVVQTACERDRSHASRKNPATVSAEGDKMLRIVDRKMRQLPAIKSMRHGGLCGDSRLRLSAEQSSAGFDSRAASGAGVGIFREAGKSNSKLGISLMARKASFARPDSRWRLSPHGFSLFPLTGNHNSLYAPADPDSDGDST